MNEPIDFEKGGGLIPAIIQDHKTGKVLMLGYMDHDALKKTREEGIVTFYSRTRKRLWTKGETSGNFLRVKSIRHDCDRDTLLIKAEHSGPVCHKGTDTCFNETNAAHSGFIFELEKIISDRKLNPKEGSYTSSLFKKGINKIAQKVGEEATEVIIEAKDNNPQLFLNEIADLVYHVLVLLKEKGFALSDVEKTLSERHRP